MAIDSSAPYDYLVNVRLVRTGDMSQTCTVGAYTVPVYAGEYSTPEITNIVPAVFSPGDEYANITFVISGMYIVSGSRDSMDFDIPGGSNYHCHDYWGDNLAMGQVTIN